MRNGVINAAAFLLFLSPGVLMRPVTYKQTTQFKTQRQMGNLIDRFAFDLLRDAEQENLAYNNTGHQVAH